MKNYLARIDELLANQRKKLIADRDEKVLGGRKEIDEDNGKQESNKDNEFENTTNGKGGLILFVNGLTQVKGFRNEFMPVSGKGYWYSENKSEPKRVLESENTEYINGEAFDSQGDTSISYASSAEGRFDSGVEYADKNYAKLTNMLRKTETQKLYIVSHSQGAAFAEGIAHQIYKRSNSNVRVDIAIHLQPSSPAFIPMEKNDVRLRIGFYTYEDPIANKFGEELPFQDFYILESRSSFEIKGKGDGYPALFDKTNTHYLYRGNELLRKIEHSEKEAQYWVYNAHHAHQQRAKFIWYTIELCLTIYAVR